MTFINVTIARKYSSIGRDFMNIKETSTPNNGRIKRSLNCKVKMRVILNVKYVVKSSSSNRHFGIIEGIIILNKNYKIANLNTNLIFAQYAIRDTQLVMH